MKLQEAWRLLRVKDGEPHTLFHGFHGSRKLVRDKLLKAVQRDVWNPGKRGRGIPPFTSGWHVLLDREECEAYLDRFTNKDDIVLCRVWVTGLRDKPRATSSVKLANHMKIKSIDWAKVLHEYQVRSADKDRLPMGKYVVGRGGGREEIALEI
jgi:hypothetical protein